MSRLAPTDLGPLRVIVLHFLFNSTTRLTTKTRGFFLASDMSETETMGTKTASLVALTAC